MFRKKHKNLKAICHSKPKIFSVGQPWWPQFFQDLEPPSPPPPPTFLVLLRPWNFVKFLRTYFLTEHH